MIKSINIKNFKAFKESGKIDFKKINVLVGPNSSGKSSFLKVLLMLGDTIKSDDQENALTLSEDIGRYESVVYGNTAKEKIGFDIEFFMEENNLLKTNESNLISSSFTAMFTSLIENLKNQSNTDKKTIAFFNLLKSENLHEFYNRNVVKNIVVTIKETASRSLKVDNLKIHTVSGSTYEIIRDKSSYYIKLNGELLPIPNLVKPCKFYFEISGDNFNRCTSDNMQVVRDIQMTFNYIQNNIKKFANSIIHLEPFRNQIRRTEYVTNFKRYSSVGSKGENMLNTVLSLKNSDTEKSKEKKEVLDEINFWVNEFQLGQHADIKEIGNSNYSLIIKNKHTGIPCNIVDVGVGTSQLLPIIIESVNSPENSILLIEEPETHIHPNAQAKLGNLFVKCAKEENKMFFIETHSMYLIMQLEILAARGEIKAEDIGVYYFKQDENGTKVMDMKLTDNGQFEEEWPEGFFDVPYKLTKELFKSM